MRLRQIALLALDLEKTVDDLCAVFGLEVGFRDPGVAAFGLVNAVLPVGDSFLEVVSPARDDASAARLLARRGHDCGYMVIVQTEDLAAARARMRREQVRIVFEHAHPAGHTAQGAAPPASGLAGENGSCVRTRAARHPARRCRARTSTTHSAAGCRCGMTLARPLNSAG